MNKKLTIISTSIAVGTIMLCATAFAALSGNSGYDTYKAAFKNTVTVKNATSKITVSVTDNGNILASVYATAKINKDKKTMSNKVAINAGSTQEAISMFKQDNKMIIKKSDSNVYEVMTQNENKYHKEKKSNENPLESNKAKDIEKVIDAFAANYENNITLSGNADGTKDVNLKLGENQISPVLNALASVAVNNISNHEGRHQEQSPSAFEKDLLNKVPKLADGIKINNVDVEAKIDANNMIQSQTEDITLTGKDAAGATHQLEIKATLELTNINTTNPDTIDLTGKQVREIQGHQRDYQE